MKIKYLYTDLPLYALLITIYLMSTVTSKTLITNFGMYDKVYHFVLFFLLGYSLYRFFSFRSADTLVTALIVVLGTTLYGLADEVHQIFVSSRSFDVYDLIADALGGLLAALIGKYLFRVDLQLYQTLKLS